MHACLYILAVLLAVVLPAAAQIIISGPETILECEQTVFTWSGGDAPYSFYYGAGHNGFGNDNGIEAETLVQDGIIEPAVEFDAPPSEGLPWRFRVADEAQNATIWMYIQPSNSCGSSTSTIVVGGPSPPPSTTTLTFTIHPPPVTPLIPPHASYTNTLSSPHDSTTTANGPPGTTGQPGSPPLTTVIATTTKQTNIPPNPTATPPNSNPNPNPNAPPGPNVSSENPPSGPGGTSGIADGSTSSEDTRTTPNQPTSSQGGSNGGNPTQTASPIRNTESQDSAPVPMSAQARVAIIGTITGAFALFVAFLCFRWRKRHQRKNRPVPVLPRVGNSGGDIMTPVTPPYDYSPPMRTNENFPVGVFALQPRPVPSPPRVLPSSKQAMAMAPRRSSSDFGSEASSPISAGTWQSELGETSRAGSASGYPDEEMPPPSLGHIPTTRGSHERYLRPTGPSSMPPPLSLQQLIGRELDNILSSPETYSPDTPLYTPTSISARDHLGRFRVANDTEQSSRSGEGVPSTSKHPHALTEDSSSQKGERARRSPVLSFADSRGGGQRQRVAISRHEMEYLADLVAARITRDSTQRTEQNQSGTGRQAPPPSYV